MKRLYFLTAVCLLAVQLFAQNTFQVLYGNTNNFFANGSTASSVVQTADGGYVIAGHTDDYAAMGDLFLLKINASGAVSWYKNFAVNDPDKKPTRVAALEKTFDSGFIIAGSVYGVFGNNDVLIMKTDSAGNVQWHKVYGANGNSEAKAVKQTAAGEYIVLGTADDVGNAASFYPNLYAIKLSATGDSLWTKSYNFNTGSQATAAGLQVLQDGNFLIGGTINKSVDSSNADRLPVLLKIGAANGNIIWSKSFGSPQLYPLNEIMNDFAVAADGGYILSGSVFINSGYTDGFIIKTDAGGNTIQWAKRYATSDSSDDEEFSSLALTPAGITNYGDMFSAKASKQFGLAITTDNNGNIKWANRLGNGNYNYGLSAISTQDNGFLFSGYEVADFNFQSTTAYVLKADADGATGCYETPLSVSVSNTNFSVGAGAVAFAGGGGIGNETIAMFDATIPVTVLCQNPAPQLQFTAFSGKKTGNNTQLSWRTKSEVKSDKYYIQRSTDKTTVTTLGEVDATYKTLSDNPYNFKDKKPAGGINYYRIKCLGKNGKITYSKVISVNNGNTIKVTNTTIPGIILFQSDGQYTSPYVLYSIYNAIGNKVYDGNLQTNNGKIFTTVNLSALQDGIYYVHINESNTVTRQPIVISH